ncbi:hypothetical protein AC579_10579 [Pseudocercospora musae]|uniref:Uncharacterized protein n=1 Tax=Pseudocercospora musae TaxID=113226 RepID=A0A139H0A3_9PEZI|nr:hypothetical protein AC579_10579 [Pseudocercospora musae]
MTFHQTEKSLGELIPPLAKELHDMIFDLTFAAPAGPITITEDYQPPPTARATRKKYLEDFLTMTFHGEAVDIMKWIASLSKEERAMLKDIRAWYDPDADEEEKTEAGRPLPGQTGILWLSSIYWPMECHARGSRHRTKSRCYPFPFRSRSQESGRSRGK